MRCPGLPSLRIMRCSMEDSSSLFFLSVWPHSWRSVRSARCHREPAHHIFHTHRQLDASHSVPARFHASARDRAGRPYRLQGVDLYRSAYMCQRPSVPGCAACSCRVHSCGIVQRLCRHIVCQQPWPSHGAHAPPCVAFRRRDGTRCDRALASLPRTSDTCRGRSARRLCFHSAAGRMRVLSRDLCRACSSLPRLRS